jgi:hypothetical protein
MNLYKINKSELIELPVKTTPQNVKEANEGLFRAKMTLPAAAKHCGMTQKEMKLTFWEYLKYHQPDWDSQQTVPSQSEEVVQLVMLDETQGGF